MANIKVSDMNLAGSQLFMDSESFLNDLTDMDATSVHGGYGGLSEYYGLNYKVLEAGLVGLGITNVVSLVKSFSGKGIGDYGADTDATTAAVPAATTTDAGSLTLTI